MSDESGSREDNGDTLFPLPERVVTDQIAIAQPAFPLWTSSKAVLISQYLRLFVHVTKHGNYIDGFAGPQNPDRQGWAAQMVIAGQPSPALDADKPRLRHFYLCDKEPSAVRALRELKSSFPDRDIQLFDGDFNEQVSDILRPEVLRPTEATFCLIDQRTFECDWETVRLLAAYKPPGLEKIELFYFLAAAWLDRAIAALGDEGRAARMRAWWGRDDWETLLGLNAWRRSELLTTRFIKELGFLSAKAWPIYESEQGSRLMYHMIHATDHQAAPNLMQRAHVKALFMPSDDLGQAWLPMPLPSA
jgi:three-Cys-motif partner protein